MAETAMQVDGLHPLAEVPALALVLLILLSFDFQNQQVAGRESNQVVRSVFAHCSPVNIVDLEAKVIVLHPRGNAWHLIQGKCRLRFPTAVVHREIYMAAPRGPAWFSREPSPHVTGRQDWTVPVKDQFQGFGIFEVNGITYVPEEPCHAERKDKASPQAIPVE